MVKPEISHPGEAERRLQELGIELPSVPQPLGAYVESLRSSNLLYLSGMLPVVDRQPKFLGRLGKELNVEQGREAARIALLNALSAAREHLGSLDRITRIVKLSVYLATDEEFLAHPKVADAASELLRELFGAGKLPVRVVLGVASLPLGMPVELEMILEVETL